MMKIYFFVFIFLCYFNFCNAQKTSNSAETKDVISLFNVGFNFNNPLSDLKERSGFFTALNLNLAHKNTKNFIFSFNNAIILGGNVLDDDLVNIFINDDNAITGTNGQQASLNILFRGYKVGLGVGKIVKTIKNQNSGILIELGGGNIFHKIKYVDGAKNLGFLTDEYLKGFDKLTNGFYLEEFLGIQFLSDDKLVNFKFGITAMQGFTKDKRTHFYGTDAQPRDDRKDFAVGLTANWIILLKKAKKESGRYYIN